MSSPSVRLALVISGRGSNARALAVAIQSGDIAAGDIPGAAIVAEIVLVICNNPQAEGVLWAQSAGFPVEMLTPGCKKEQLDAELSALLIQYGVDLVILAGFDRIVGPKTLDCVSGRILNIHPSLLPAFGGRGMVGDKVHRAVLDAGVTETGCTVHWVSEVVDGGPIVAQRRVPVYPDDSVETLSKRVLSAEHLLYSEAVLLVLKKWPSEAPLFKTPEKEALS
ncbi:MAG: phosphoribosylglycinamide formyltransferase [Cyanobacteria bacterium]|nr:phosphoribosylglycinamide formyltransferase [Cyanobacteriota bacterium]